MRQIFPHQGTDRLKNVIMRITYTYRLSWLIYLPR